MPTPHRPLRVLFFCHTNQLGGAEKSALDVVHYLQKKGYQVRAVLPDKGNLVHAFNEVNVPVSIVNYFWWCSAQWPTGLTRYTWFLTSIFSTIWFRVRYPQFVPDLVMTNTLTIPWGMLYSRLVRKPHIMLIREFGNLDFDFDFLLGYETSVNLINRFSDYVFTNSRTTRAHFLQYIDRQKIGYFYPNVKSSLDSLPETDEKYFSSSRYKILSLGTIHESKGQLDVVKAVLQLVKKGYRDIELILAGHKQSQAYYGKIRRAINAVPKANKYIRIYSFIDNPHAILDEADIVVISSQNEAFGRITAESLLMEKAIIASDSGANQELLQDEVNALLYPTGDVHSLAEKIEQLYHNPILRKKLGTQGAQTFEDFLHPKTTINPLHKVSQKLVE